MNVKLLRRIIKAIKKEPRQFDMGTWFAISPIAPNCGTTACIAGWAIALSKKANPLLAAKSIRKTFGGSRLRALNFNHSSAVAPIAAKALGLTAKEAARLFYSCDWPTRFADELFEDYDAERRAGVAVRRIERFIETKGAQ